MLNTLPPMPIILAFRRLHHVTSLSILVCVALGVLSGCAGDPDSKSVSAQPQDAFNQEPHITARTHFATGQLAEAKVLELREAGADPRQVRRYQNAALKQYAKALELDRNHAPSLYRTGVLHTEQRQFDAAVAAWETYAEAVGRTPDSLTNLGLSLELAGRPVDAETAYVEATRRDPAHKPANVNLGMLLAKQGRLQPATRHLSAVLGPASVHWHLGLALQAADKQAAADREFRAAAAIDPAFAKRPELPQAGIRD